MTTERELLREARDALDAIANLREEARWDLAKRIDTYLATPEQPAVQRSEVEVIDPWVMDLVRKHGHEMTNSEIVQKFLPKNKLSAPAPSGAAKVPEGWKLVPVEPTPAMVEAGYKEWTHWQTTPSGMHEFLRTIYRALLAAASAQDNEEKAR